MTTMPMQAQIHTEAQIRTRMSEAATIRAQGYRRLKAIAALTPADIAQSGYNTLQEAVAKIIEETEQRLKTQR